MAAPLLAAAAMAAGCEAQDMGGAVLSHDPGPIRPAQAGSEPAGVKVDSAEYIGGDWKTFYDFLPDKEDPFLFSVDGRKPLSYSALRAFIADGRNDIPGVGREDRICTAIPNGPELAVAYLVFAVRCTLAPLNLFLKAEEFEFEFEDLPAKGLIVQKAETLGEEDKAATGVAVTEARKRKIATIQHLIPSTDTAGLFTMEKHPAGKPPKGEVLKALETVRRDHICLVLHTSGTTKKPKIVPITHESMAIGAKCHAACNLMTCEDVFINTMPMFHIAGLLENLLMTAVSGAKLIALPGLYQPHIFYKYIMSEPFPTTYSAVPAHHLTLMSFAKEMEKADKMPHENHLKFIRNDSAALLPSIAEQMEEFLKCTVMPAYSMTEANPLCSNPRYGQRKLKSVGPAIGLELAVMARFPESTRMQVGEEGEVCVKGPAVMKGYEMRPHMDQDPNAETFTDGFMRSGDKGWLDEDGYLYLVGRFKELINRAGEKISPFDVEDKVRVHEAVKDVLCFSCPHQLLGEAVGVVVVLRDGKSLKLFDLRQWLMASQGLQDKWCPEVLILMKDLPKGATGKPARINLAKRLELEALDGALVEREHPGL